MDFLITVIQYLFAIREENDHIDIKNIASRELIGGDKRMGTIEEMLERRGEERAEQRFVKEREKLAIMDEQQGKIEASREMLLDALVECFGTINRSLIAKIKNIQSIDALKVLFKQCFRVDSLEAFEEQVRRATE